MGPGPLHDITLGGSYWTGNRTFGEPLANQATAGGYTFFSITTYSNTQLHAVNALVLYLIWSADRRHCHPV